MHAVQGELGKRLESEMSVHAQKGREVCESWLTVSAY